MADQKFWHKVAIDYEAHLRRKPTGFGIFKALLLEPSCRTLFRYRLSALMSDNAIGRFVRLWFWSSNAEKGGCYISPKCVIEPGVILVHASGIVIGEGAVIKSGARLYQNVTIGGKDWQQDKTQAVIEEGAIIYAGAVIAGSWTIGKNAVVAANSVVISDVPENALAAGAPAQIKNKS